MVHTVTVRVMTISINRYICTSTMVLLGRLLIYNRPLYTVMALKENVYLTLTTNHYFIK